MTTYVKTMIMSPVIFTDMPDNPTLILYQSATESLSFPVVNNREYWMSGDHHPDGTDEHGIGRGDLLCMFSTALNSNAANVVYTVSVNSSHQLVVTSGDLSSFKILFGHGSSEIKGSLFGCETILESTAGVATGPYPVYGRWTPSVPWLDDSRDNGHGVGSSMVALDGTSTNLAFGKTKPTRSVSFDHLVESEMLIEYASHANAAWETYWQDIVSQHHVVRIYDDSTDLSTGEYGVYRAINTSEANYARSNAGGFKKRWQQSLQFRQVTSEQTYNELAAHLLDGPHAVDPYLWAHDGCTSFTWSFWIRVDSGGMLLQRGSGSGSSIFEVELMSDEALRVEISSSEVEATLFDIIDDDMFWQHVAIVYDGSQAAADRIRIFHNAVERIVQVNTGTVPSSIAVSSAPFSFKLNDGEKRMSSVTYWKEPLTSAQVSKVYNSGMPQSPMNYWTIPRPVHWWPLNNDLGDYAGNQNLTTGVGVFSFSDYPGYCGEITEAATPVAPEPDTYSVQFDNVTNASGGYIDAGTGMSATMAARSFFTVAFWYKQNSSNDIGFLIDSTGASSAYGYWSIRASSNVWDMRMCNASGALSTRTNWSYTRVNGQWEHLVFIYDGSEAANADKLKLYRNNTLVAATVASAAPANLASVGNNSSSKWTFGVEWSGGTTFQDGLVDTQLGQIVFYDKIFTTTDVAELYNGGSAADPETLTTAGDLLFYFKFDDLQATAPTATDRIGGVSYTINRYDASDFKLDMP